MASSWSGFADVPASAPVPGTGPARSRPSHLIGARYQIINELGHGGMGSVYRVVDRLTGRVVTLKRLKVPGKRASAGDGRSTADDRVTLAHEFQLLASLRHPNIISVLDYGFDEEGEPYFTMDLQENGRTIVEAGTGAPLAVQVELLVQTLRALDYLHRHDIIHRDLKPENILVVRDQVKVLDFGLSLYREAAERRGGEFAGTLAYMAPEVLRGETVSHHGDLYAVGMIAYELFTGSYPFHDPSHLVLQRQILETLLPRATDDLDSRLRPILVRLLTKRPADRSADASAVIADLAAALELPLSSETVATRESFLQGAPLIGRGEELARLTEILRAATEGNGSTWLVGGESGVGKSRLLEEVRTRALVRAILVVRGEGMSQGGGPYHVWRDVVSSLVLRVDVSDAEAGVLKAIVPEIATLLGRDVEEPPPVSADAAQSRLMIAVEEVLRRQPAPVLVILEDLHWVGSESLRMLDWLARTAGGLPLVVLGSFRNDEAPDLPAGVWGANVITLRRLDAAEIAALGEAMMGPAARRPEVGRFLERETEGIPFFVVEVVRALAESSGGLTRVAGSPLPERVVAGGMQRVIRRRVRHVSRDALPPLNTAAVIGRALEPQLMQLVHPELDFESWSAHCAAAAVLEVQDQRWRFAHDKLREQLLEDMSSTSRRVLHRRVAEAIERASPDRITALAYHWQQAGDTDREAGYAHQAGILALQSGASKEAVVHLTRALEILRLSSATAPQPTARAAAPRVRLDPNTRIDPQSPAFRLGTIEGGLAEAYFRLGDLRACRQHGEAALRYFGRPIPSGRVALVAGTLQQAGLRALQVFRRPHTSDPVRAQLVATEIGRVQLLLMETCFYALRVLPLVWSTLQLLNQCEPAGPSPPLAQGYSLATVLVGVMPVPLVLAETVGRRAREIAGRTGMSRDVARVLSRVAVFQVGVCRWDEAEAGLRRAAAIAEEVSDLRLWEECRTQLGLLFLYSGEFERALPLFRDALRVSRRSSNRQTECWALIGEGDILVRLGSYHQACALFGEAAGLLDPEVMRTETVWTYGMLALARLRSSDPRGAYEAAERALSQIVGTLPVAYWTQQGLAATAEVLLSLVEEEERADPAHRLSLAAQARQAVVGLRRYAARFPLGRPHACLWAGLEAWVSGRHRRALRLWRRTITHAERLRTPYERGRAHLEIGRHLPPASAGRRHHLIQAVELFERLGCAADLERARHELEHSRAPLDRLAGSV